MPVRDATPDDAEALHQMVVELAEFEQATDEVRMTAEGLRAHLGAEVPGVRALLAHPDGRPDEAAGMALWYPTFSTWVGEPGIWLEDLYVRPAHRRAGHARALLDALAARTPGRVEWAVLDWNDGAIAFYDGLGAVPVPGWTRYRWVPGGGHQ